MNGFFSRIVKGAEVVECDLHPGVLCKVKNIVKLSESSRCKGCRHAFSCQYDEVLAHSPRNATVAGMPVPATTGGCI